MDQQIEFNRDHGEFRDRRHSIRSGSELIRSEGLHIRNYDRDWSYDLSIEIIDSDGEVSINERYYLQPMEVKSIVDIVPDGTHEVRATLDDSVEDTLQCRIDSSPENTAVIEIGNGTLSLTQGLRV